MRNTTDDKQENIDGYSNIKGKFHKNPHYELLKKIVKKSKDIPNQYRDQALYHLRKDDITNLFIGDGKKYKHLFVNAIFYRAYDIFTSSIMAYHLRNRNSIYLLLRSQLENMGKIAFYINHPDRIKEAFDPAKDTLKVSDLHVHLGNLYKRLGYPDDFNEERMKGMADYFSCMAHPLSDGLKMYYGGMAIMTRVPDSPYPVFKPTLNMKAHHCPYDEDEKNFYFPTIVMFLTEIIRLLILVKNLDVDDEMDDYSELHTSWTNKNKNGRNENDN